MRLSTQKVHFIGIGGIGMCGLAELLHNMGAEVSGSDLGENAQTLRLKEMGLKIQKGHAAENIGEAEVVVFSSAVMADNPEFVEARRRGIPIIRRAEALAEIMRLKRGIAIGGTHGKTTTTSLTASIFLSAGQDPTIAVGGRLDIIKSTAKLGQGEWMIAEADESDGSFTRLSPEIVVITNIDNDHLDHYGDMEVLQRAFGDFASRVPFYGTVIACGDDFRLRQALRDYSKRLLYYGFDQTNQFRVDKQGQQVRILEQGELIAEFTQPIPGAHNALNATAALLAARAAGIDLAVSAKAISLFAGVDRRFQHKAHVRGIDLYDDYGHHPTEVAAVLQALTERFPDRRRVVVFQPHRYSRTQICWAEFLNCFKGADELWLMDIYPAGEKPIPGVNTESLLKEIRHERAHHLDRQQNPALEAVARDLREGDVVLTLGAGDIFRFGERMMESLAKGQGRGG